MSERDRMPDHVDAEVMARLMEGRLAPDERARVLHQLAHRPDLLEQLADAASALEAGDAPGGAHRSARTGWWRPAYVLAAAAGIAALAFGVARTLEGGSAYLFEPDALVPDGVADLRAIYGDTWAVPARSLLRTGVPADSAPGTPLAGGDSEFLAGVHAVRWRLAVARGDTTVANAEQDTLIALLRDLSTARPGADPDTQSPLVLGPIVELVRQSTDELSFAADVDVRVARVADSRPRMAAGLWAEQVRLATATLGEARVRDDSDVFDGLDRILSMPGLDATSADLLGRMRPALEGDQPLLPALLDLYESFAR